MYKNYTCQSKAQKTNKAMLQANMYKVTNWKLLSGEYCWTLHNAIIWWSNLRWLSKSIQSVTQSAIQPSNQHCVLLFLGITGRKIIKSPAEQWKERSCLPMWWQLSGNRINGLDVNHSKAVPQMPTWILEHDKTSEWSNMSSTAVRSNRALGIHRQHGVIVDL